MAKKTKKQPVVKPTIEVQSMKKKRMLKQDEVMETKKDNSTGDNAELKYLRYILSDKFSCQRHLFLKRDLSSTNSLIVANIPAFLDIDIVKSFLTQFVRTETFSITSARSSAIDGNLEFGHITLSVSLDSDSAVTSALKQCESVGPYKASDFGFTEPDTSLKKSLERYRALFMNADALQSSIDAYMQHHDEAILQAKKEAKRKCTEPDDDGWITVTKASKKVANVVKMKKTDVPLTGGLNKKKKAVDLAFYSFQTKDSKMKKAQELRAKFEEDKKRVAMLKNARLFKPY